jgi:tetratricopeptide (TPR) repeat protein
MVNEMMERKEESRPEEMVELPDDGVLFRLRERFEKAPDDIDAALRLAAFYVNRGWYNQAKGVFQNALKINSKDFTLLLEYGNTCFKKGELNEAGSSFRTLTQLRPDKIEAWNNLGIVQIQEGDLEGARHSFEKVIQIEPENAGALLNMGNYHAGKSQHEEALVYFKRAVEVMPGFADGWYNLGNTLMKLDKFDESVEAFEKALKYRGEFTSALKNLGFVYERQKKIEEAQRCYTRAIELNKADPSLRINLGGIYLLQDRINDARECFFKAVRLAPQDTGGWLGLREVALINGDIQTFNRATLAALPRLGESIIAESIEVLLDLDHKSAADEIVQQIDRLGKTGDLLDAQRICCYFLHDGDNEKNRSIFNRLLTTQSQDHRILKSLARYAYLSGKYDQVIDLVNKIDKPDDYAYSILWRSLIELKKDTQARRLIQNYIKDYPQNSECWYLLALVEARRGHRIRTEKFLLRALENGFANLEELKRESIMKEILDSIKQKQDTPSGNSNAAQTAAEHTGSADGKRVVL